LRTPYETCDVWFVHSMFFVWPPDP
jgi:hypothetical protein